MTCQKCKTTIEATHYEASDKVDLGTVPIHGSLFGGGAEIALPTKNHHLLLECDCGECEHSAAIERIEVARFMGWNIKKRIKK